MSLKSTRPKRSPRAMPMETIITRFKSAQQKRQQQKGPTRNISKSVQSAKQQTSKTDLTNSILVSKCEKKIERSVKVEDANECVEFRPDKLKRKEFNKKIVLAPKNCFKVIGGTKSYNKRKLHVPRKDIKHNIKHKRHQSTSSSYSELDAYSPKHNSHNSTELSVRDMILLIEEEGTLDDEDMLEILTCPSPVWWEDPPDGYIEESIFSREKPEERVSVKHQLLEEQVKEAERIKKIKANNRSVYSNNVSTNTENFDVSKLNISITNRDESFKNKRFKLESLLGNIKNKVKNRVNNEKRNKNKIRIKTPEDINGQKFKCDNNNISNSGLKGDMNFSKDSTQTGTTQSIEDESFLDLADEDVSNLENIEIPIAPKDESCKTSETSLVRTENDIRKYKIYEDLPIKKNEESINHQRSKDKMLPLKSNKNDQVCIDLCSDNSNDSISTDQVIVFKESSTIEDTNSSTSKDRLFEDISKKIKKYNSTIASIKKISNYDKLRDLMIKGTIKNKNNSNLVNNIKSCSIKKDRNNDYWIEPISKVLYGKTYNNTSIKNIEIKTDKFVPVDGAVKNKACCNPIEHKNINDLIDIKPVEINDCNLDDRTFELNKNFNISNDRSRKNSISSNESDKNMSEEYLDMSLFEDDDMKGDVINEITDSNLKDYTVPYREQSLKLQDTINKISSFKDIKIKINSHNIGTSNETDNNERKILLGESDGEICGNQYIEYNKYISSTKEPNRNMVSVIENSVSRIKNDDKTEYVAVYKIIHNDSDNDDNLDETGEANNRINNNDIIHAKSEDGKTAEKVNGHLDSYYKQRKMIMKYKENITTIDMTKDDSDGKKDCVSCNIKNKSIIINENETIKYCLICSSIFDTKECKYCIRKSKNQCSCKSDGGKYVCDVCDLKLYSKNDIISHLSEHSSNPQKSWDHLYT